MGIRFASVSDLFIWTARCAALFNVGLASVAFWGLSMMGSSGRHLVAQFAGAALLVSAVTAAVVVFRPLSGVSTVAAVTLISTPLLWLIVAPLGPPGDTPVRDALLGLVAFGLPAILIAVARGL